MGSASIEKSLDVFNSITEHVIQDPEATQEMWYLFFVHSRVGRDDDLLLQKKHVEISCTFGKAINVYSIHYIKIPKKKKKVSTMPFQMPLNGCDSTYGRLVSRRALTSLNQTN